MSREYCFNLTVPLAELALVETLLGQARQRFAPMRISRKPDRHEAARFYLSFEFSAARKDLHFQQWFSEYLKEDWELFGPNPGRWGLL
jgi:hypothetical protein